MATLPYIDRLPSWILGSRGFGELTKACQVLRDEQKLLILPWLPYNELTHSSNSFPNWLKKEIVKLRDHLFVAAHYFLNS
ncbi:MAG: hypothetical protein J6O89_01055 [Aeriscardovia sp.]|nr:hypothetical protein [Aeriscardovia sp.]